LIAQIIFDVIFLVNRMTIVVWVI